MYGVHISAHNIYVERVNRSEAGDEEETKDPQTNSLTNWLLEGNLDNLEKLKVEVRGWDARLY